MFTFKSYYEKSKNKITELKEEMVDKVLIRYDNPRQFKIKTVALKLWAENSFHEIDAVTKYLNSKLVKYRKLVEDRGLVEDSELVEDIQKAINVGKEAIIHQQQAVIYVDNLVEINKDNLNKLSNLLDATKETIDQSNLFAKILNSGKDSPPQPASQPPVDAEDEEKHSVNGGYKKRKSNRKRTRTRKPKPKRKWTLKYKRSINCRHPKGFSQRQHCKYGRKTMRKLAHKK